MVLICIVVAALELFSYFDLASVSGISLHQKMSMYHFILSNSKSTA